MLNAILLVGAIAQDDPRENVSLQPGEIVRYHRTGGMTIDGGRDDKVVVTARKIFVKSKSYSNTFSLSGELKGRFTKLMRADLLRAYIEKPKETQTWPSTYDGTDNVLRVRSNGLVIEWNNRDFENPAEPSLTSFLDELLIPPQP